MFASTTLLKANKNRKGGISNNICCNIFSPVYLPKTSLLGLLAENKPIPGMTTVRIQRWEITLSSYDYTLTYHSGRQNSNADCMSKLNFNLGA